MQKETMVAKMARTFFNSPFFLLIFLVIPVFTVVNLKLHLPVSGDLLLGNNIGFGLCLLARLVWYLKHLSARIRYGAEYAKPSKVVALSTPAGALRSDLTAAGYQFDAAGRYAEKRDAGYLGTLLLYAGMLLLLSFGSYDYLREYSIMLRLGVGEPTALDGTGLVGQFEAGNLASTKSLPKLRVTKQILPNAQYPKGASEIALLSPQDNKVLTTGVLTPGKPFSYSGLDFYMNKFIFDALVTIKTGNYLVYDSFVKFLPLAKKKGDFSYVGRFKDPDTGNLKGDVLLKPENKEMKITATLKGQKIIDTDLQLWGENKKTQGIYVVGMEGLAHWSEIRVARARHRMMLGAGAILALLGGLLRLAVRPQRVWLEEDGVRAAGAHTYRLIDPAK